MNTNIYRISNAKIICRLLPFFARGRKTILFLEAIASPLTSLHKQFLAWSYEMVVNTKVTFQTIIFVWYLNHKFRHHFAESSDTFEILQDQNDDGLAVFYRGEHELMGMFASRVYNVSERDMLADYSQPLDSIVNHISVNTIVIKAPVITETDKYGYSQYIREILAIVEEYKTSFGKCNVIIKE